MCYSAQIIADYRRYSREFGAQLSLKDFVDLFWHRRRDPSVKIPKSMELALADATAGRMEEGGEHADMQQIATLVDEYATQQSARLEQELFKQRKRLADAERSLQAKPTKAALESQRISTRKIETTLVQLSDLRRTVVEDRDARIFPGHYAPVIVMEGGRRIVKPMRYQCRPAGKPAAYDRKFPGTYNARRDSLGGFWKDLYGYSHGLLVVNAFYENVNRHRTEGRELAPGEPVENLVLEFKPRPQQDMLVACLWSRWAEPGEPELLSFAAITDEPPDEVAAAGHDRCIVAIKPEHVDAWLNPDPENLAAQEAILADRACPYYEHRLAA